MTVLLPPRSDSTSITTQIYTIVSARSLKQKGNQRYSSRRGQMTIIIFLTSNGSLSLTELERHKEVEIKYGTCLVLKGAENSQIITW
ncbi:hypothetical protein, partial [Pseudomonas agarici]